ncbi:MAG TPA: sialate O-acetylesterase [Phenylobacterium sp.]|uniref:sialate O-acetylesterase n=1 Tax=Phenylobacterium sp. TaxID=1871053 RepID=UPI002F93F375
MDLPPACEPPALVVVAGQSNALGYTLGRSDLPPHLQTPVPDAWIWNPLRKGFEPLAPGSNTGAPNNPQAWGPEAQFAWRWRAAHPCAPLYVVKHARGDTGLAADPAARDWSISSRGELFDAASTEVSAAKAALAVRGAPVRVSAVLWMQGEKDATDRAKGDAYETNLRAFIARVRARWGDAQTVFEIGRIDDLGDGYPGASAVRRAQARVAETSEHVTLTDTDAFPRQPSDGLHLTAKAQVALGDGFFEAGRKVAP